MNYFKIWFAKEKDGELKPLGGMLNEVRLIRCKADLDGQLYLISNYDKFSDEKAKQYVIDFCKTHDIALISFSIFEDYYKNPDADPAEKILFDIAKDELSSEDGHPVVASDIIRILSPALKLGMYSDVDLALLAHKSYQLTSELILDLRFTFDSIKFTNQLIYVDETKNPFAKLYRNEILNTYLNIDKTISLLSEMLATTGNRPYTQEELKFIFKLNDSEHNELTDQIYLRKQFKKYCKKNFDTLFKLQVMLVTGPFALYRALQDYAEKYEESFDRVMPLLQENLPILRTVSHSDCSWIEGYQKELKIKNDNIEKAAICIQNAIRNYKNTSFWQQPKEVIQNTAEAVSTPTFGK